MYHPASEQSFFERYNLRLNSNSKLLKSNITKLHASAPTTLSVGDAASEAKPRSRKNYAIAGIFIILYSITKLHVSKNKEASK